MASKQNQLVQTLLDQNQQLNATQLANSLGVSVRTVHNYINAVNAQYQDAIVSTPTGYRIAPAMAQQMLHQSPNDIPQNAQDRGGAVSFELDQVHPHDVAQLLDSRGVAVRAGHHCCKPAHARFGVQASCRASSYLYTTPGEIDALVEGLNHTKKYFRVD